MDDKLNSESPRQLTREGFSRLFRSVLGKGITALEWDEFENFAAVLFELLGYSVELTPSTDDQGVDLKLFVDKHSPTLEVVQCKHWKDQIGSPVVRDFYGAMLHFNARKGFLLATGGFTESARQFAQGKPILLWSLEDLIDQALAVAADAEIISDKRLRQAIRNAYRSIEEQVRTRVLQEHCRE